MGVTKGYYQRVTTRNFANVFSRELSGYEEKVPNFTLYESVLDLVNEKYYGDINYLDVLYGSIKGAVAGLGDPYTSFSTPEENQAFFTDLEGIYEGVGVEIDFVGDRLLVIAPLEGSPAKEAGLLPKDEIVAIDGRAVMGMDLYSVLALIRGPRGSRVILTIYREGSEELKDFTVTRGVIHTESVGVTMRDGVAVMRITKFGGDTEQLFDKAVNQIVREGAKGVVLDLRNNPGGYLDVAVKVANEFLDGGLIVEERFKDGKVTPFTADGDGKLSELPVVVLVDAGSASAAEIVAGALRDNNRAKIVGENTYGKGSVQEVEEFGDGSALRITIAHWYTPGGSPISGKGIKPDILVRYTGGDTDTQLERALSEIKKIIQ
ncbi:hypothetical protein A2V68_02230 [candidate division Kazan bacterium RBG_13_50_9]|uniref:PDZ domain-containing protein n=1 Tax=candidate division Kazan bacterium RBG_13_50_9 TaxID=1798535 RepID=A0A1F4NTE1_UNCK3|nr:MAG: hypothetical protein A2V68_02230 [candidate division Kazan bacterium RBG_13_50_9]